MKKKRVLVQPSTASNLRMTCGLGVLMCRVTRHQSVSPSHSILTMICYQAEFFFNVAGILTVTSVILESKFNLNTTLQEKILGWIVWAVTY